MAAALARKEASPVQSSLVQCSPVQCSTVEASTVQSSAVQYSAMQHCITVKSMVRIPTGRHHRRHLYQRGHRQPRRRGGRFARDMRHTVAPIVVRLHRWAGGLGLGLGLGLVKLSNRCKVYHTLRLRPWCRGRGRS